MSAAQVMASQQFLEAMGSMIYEEAKMKQVMVYINSLHHSTSTISQDKWDSLRTIDDLDSHLENKIRNHYSCVEA